MLDVALLGTGGMMPLPTRYLTAMLLRHNGKLLLVDCGEGTQVTHKILGWGFKNIDIICFTHIHGDHITGLPGLLLTIGNSNRQKPITIIGPIGIEFVVKSLLVVAPDLPFELKFIELSDEKNTVVSGDFNISVLPLDHRIACFAYSIEIKRVGKFNKEKALKNKVPMAFWRRLQKKENINENNFTYTSDMILDEDRKSIKISYMTDTRPVPSASEFVYKSDLFICEGIYGQNEKLEKAIEHKHMIFSEAATIARDGNVFELWLTHFSPALTEPEEFLEVATDIFPNTKIGEDRMFKFIRFK